MLVLGRRAGCSADTRGQVGPVPDDTKKITIAHATHRLETLPEADALMREHEAIVLEEPPDEDLAEVLDGRMAAADYPALLDAQFPEFSRRLCEVLRDHKRRGATILQVDPYLEVLAGIHDLFESGGRPRDIDPHTLQGRVYAAEHAWTAALLEYYESSGRKSFSEVIDKVKAFARRDAQRGLLRDELRAGAVAKLVDGHDSLYVETGSAHWVMPRALRRWVDERAEVREVRLLGGVMRSMANGRMTHPPGDLLTRLFAFDLESDGDCADLLAARSLVYVQLLTHDEMAPSDDPYPHTRDEVTANLMVSRLSYDDCARLYPELRPLSTADARCLVERELRRLARG
jgi:hypothetical protein